LNDWLYRPLSLVMFAIEWQVAPATPALGHLVSVLLYAVTAAVLFRFLRDLFVGYDVVVPFAIALLWIAHPIHTEVVANIKSRDELLSFLFSILTLWQCVKYVSEPSRRHLLLSGLYFFLALMSKESPITLLVIVPMTLFVFRRPDAKTMLRAVAPIGMAAVVYLAIRSSVLTSQTGSSSAISLIDNSLTAAPDFLHRQATAFYIGAMYLRLLVFPHPMSSDYSFRQVPVVGFDNPVAIGSLLVHVGLLTYGVVRLRKRDPVAYGILYYLISIALVANVLFLTRSTMADRFLYAPSLGFSIVLVLLLVRVLRLDVKSGGEDRPWSVNPVFVGVVGLILVPSIALTWARNPDWKNDTTLFSADSRHSPNSARIHFMYGNHMLQELTHGNVEASRQDEYYNIALAEFRRAIALYPSYAEPHMLIGDAYTYRKDYAAAANWYTGIVTRNPRFGAGYIYLGNTYVSMGDNAKAIAAFQKALVLNPNDAGVNYLLGTAYRAQGDTAVATQYLEKAYTLDPRMKH
jgi:tetratricopeptide (TPR) repeat protein